jgi:hypothetical protein
MAPVGSWRRLRARGHHSHRHHRSVGLSARPDITVPARTSRSWMAALVIGVQPEPCCSGSSSPHRDRPYLGPRALVYPGLVILITLVVWLSVFRG